MKPTTLSKSSTLEQVHLALTGEDDGRLCRDIPDSACKSQPQHFFIHVLGLGASKIADGFLDPKLVLSWLLSQLGASSIVIGLLVPIREAGALLPQLLTAKWIREREKRKWVWAAGTAIQGLCVFAMIMAVVLLPISAAGPALIFLLLLLAIARSFCSVAYKDVLAKTVSKSTRGTATGLATSIASAVIVAFALLLLFSVVPTTISSVLWLLGLSGLLWLLASTVFLQLGEESGETDGGKSAASGLLERMLKAFKDKQFIIYVITRALLTASALAPPYILLLQTKLADPIANDSSASVVTWGDRLFDSSSLGLFLLASSMASLLSSYVWGRLSDRSSRKVLIASGWMATFAFALILLIDNFSFRSPIIEWALPMCLFLTMIAYQGVRLGRSIHLVDMSSADMRGDFTAIANTMIGGFLLLASGIGALANTLGLTWVFSIFIAMSISAACIATRLDEVQKN